MSNETPLTGSAFTVVLATDNGQIVVEHFTVKGKKYLEQIKLLGVMQIMGVKRTVAKKLVTEIDIVVFSGHISAIN